MHLCCSPFSSPCSTGAYQTLCPCSSHADSWPHLARLDSSLNLVYCLPLIRRINISSILRQHMLSSVTSNLLSWVPSWRRGVELQSGVSRIQDCGRALQSNAEMDSERPDGSHETPRALTRFEEMLRDAWTPELLQEHLPRRQSRLWLACVSRAAYSAVMPSVLPMAGSHLARMKKPGVSASSKPHR